MLNTINGVVEIEALQAIVDTMILFINMYPTSRAACSFKGLYNYRLKDTCAGALPIPKKFMVRPTSPL